MSVRISIKNLEGGHNNLIHSSPILVNNSSVLLFMENYWIRLSLSTNIAPSSTYILNLSTFTTSFTTTWGQFQLLHLPPLIISSRNRRQSDHSNMYIRSRHSSVQSLHFSMLFIKTSTILTVNNSSLGISLISNMFGCSPAHLSAPFTLASLLFLKHTMCISAQGI